MAGKDAFGTRLQRRVGGGGPGAWETVAHATSIGGPGLSREEYDVTTHQSPGQWEEIIFGIKRSGEVSVDVNYNPAEHDGLLSDFSDPNPLGYRMVWPDDSEWEFEAGLTGFEPDAPHDGQLTASLTFKLSGEPNFNNGNGGGTDDDDDDDDDDGS